MAGISFTDCAYTLLLVLISSDLSKCQDPVIYFTVNEEEAGIVIGDISQSEYIRGQFNPSGNAELRYEIQEQNNLGRDISLFEVDEDTGVLMTAKPINREDQDDCHGNEYCSLQLTVKIEAVIDGQNTLKIPTIEIEILDINDSPPEFEPGSLSFQITEGSPSGTSRDLPEATDKDSPDNNVDPDGYELQSDVQGLFDLERDEEGLKLVLRQELDRETTDSYNLKLLAFDKGDPDSLSGSLDIQITINDANDEEPEFVQNDYAKEVREDTSINSTIIRVEAKDPDLGLNAEVEYRFDQLTNIRDGDKFGINKETGSIYLKKALDYETEVAYELVVEARDKGANPKTSSTTVAIQVTDVNDEIPRVSFKNKLYLCRGG